MSIRLAVPRWFLSLPKPAACLILLVAICCLAAPLEAQVQALAPNTVVNLPPVDETPYVVSYDAMQPRDVRADRVVDVCLSGNQCWDWQLLPDGLMYPAYLSGGRESRMGSAWVYESSQGWLWDMAVGGRFGLFRYGTEGMILPQGWQVDIEGAAFPRLDPEEQRSYVACDFRFGIPLTYRSGAFEGKFAYYHISSHLGDEYMVMHNTLHRINYSRDVFVLGGAYRLQPSVRLYGEVGWAFYTDGGSKPWEFQFGVDCSTPYPTTPSGAPFLAINARLRQEVDYGGNMTVETGWQWRSQSGKLMRLGMRYFNGMSDQSQFFKTFENQLGFGAWFDY